MFETFSTKARLVIFWARVEAGRLGSEMMEPEHILMGFLVVDQDDGAQALARHLGNERFGIVPGTTPSNSFFSGERAGNLRKALAESATPADPIPDVINMPTSRSCQGVLLAAKTHAGDARVTPLHILWALLSDEDSSVSNLLSANGTAIDQVEQAIRLDATQA